MLLWIEKYTAIRAATENIKCTIYKTLIKPMVLYECESWILKKTDKGKLSMSERKILRKIYGPTCFNGI
jgi:hypothetical protein